MNMKKLENVAFKAGISNESMKKRVAMNIKELEMRELETELLYKSKTTKRATIKYIKLNRPAINSRGRRGKYEGTAVQLGNQSVTTLENKMNEDTDN